MWILQFQKDIFQGRSDYFLQGSNSYKRDFEIVLARKIGCRTIVQELN